MLCVRGQAAKSHAPGFPPVLSTLSATLPHPFCSHLPVQLAAFIFRYHTAMGLNLASAGAFKTGVPAAALVLQGGDSGTGVSTTFAMSSAELSQQLTPGSSGRGPFDLAKYPGFCRKMRVRGSCLAAGLAVALPEGWPFFVCQRPGQMHHCCTCTMYLQKGSARSMLSSASNCWPIRRATLPPPRLCPAAAQCPRADGTAHVADGQAAQRHRRVAGHPAIRCADDARHVLAGPLCCLPRGDGRAGVRRIWGTALPPPGPPLASSPLPSWMQTRSCGRASCLHAADTDLKPCGIFC